MGRLGDRGGFALASVVAVALVAGAVAYVAVAGLGSGDGDTGDGERAVPAQDDAPDPDAPQARLADGAQDLLPGDGTLLVRGAYDTDERAPGRLFELTRDGDAAPSPTGNLLCARVDASADGPGLCLTKSEAGFGYQGVIVDAELEPQTRFALPGTPDRTRVSDDGRYGAYTAFDSGESSGYAANSDEFTTYSTILDLETAEPLLHLEELDVTRDGEPFDAEDGNFWGVTFLGDSRFYATLGVGLDTYLIEGDWETGKAEIVREDVECPSISPDGSRIAYKRRIGRNENWRIHVLDLDSGDDTQLAGDDVVDDQPEWLDDDHVVYGVDGDVIVADADGGGEARPLVLDAASPATVP